MFWARSMRGWDLAFYAMVAIGVATLALEVGGTPAFTTSVGLLAVLVLLYVVVARRGLRTGGRRRTRAYLAALVLITVLVVYVAPVGTVLLFVAYSQIWYLSESRRAGVALSAVLTVGVFGALALHDGAHGPRLADLLAQGGIALAFSVLLGLWVTQVAEQSEERAELLDRLQAAQALLAASHHAAGVTAERERMAREIHDTLAQGFTSIVMLAQTARRDLDRGDGTAAHARLALVEDTARDNLAEARALVASFSPVALEGATLEEALERLAARFAAETGTDVDVRLDPRRRPLGRPGEVVLLRAAQEALSNVRRHAGAARVRLELGTADDAGGVAVRLEVDDDGRGLPADHREGFGLRGMRERVSSGGGTLDVGTTDGGGTRVRVTLPARGPEDEREGTT